MAGIVNVPDVDVLLDVKSNTQTALLLAELLYIKAPLSLLMVELDHVVSAQSTKAVGTSADNVVQLDGSARLPAVDGSQLTNLPSTGASIGDAIAFSIALGG